MPKKPAHIIPDEALRQHVAIVGTTGSGKTYTAKGLVERLLDQKRRVCILDPTGAWWGLRTKPDGKKPGYPVMIFGGDHADVPLTKHAGDAVARIVAEHNVPSIIDLSETRMGERQTFVRDFADTLYQLNRQALHLVIDEADEFAPQNPLPETKRMLHAIDMIVRRGRVRGFRVMLISQRPAVIHKNVLTQANTLVAMQLTSPQDRKAIEGWVQGQADAGKGREVLASLAGLQVGEGWAWCPSHEILTRTKFPKIRTYDSSRTPDDTDVAPPPATLAEVDVSGIREAMEAAVEEVEANSPAELKKTLARLKDKLSETECQLREALNTPVVGGTEFDAAVSRAVRDREAEIYRGIDEWLAPARETLARVADDLTKFREISPARPAVDKPGRVNSEPKRPAQVAPAPRPAASDGVGGPFRQIASAIAWWGSVGVSEPSAAQVAFVAGYSPKGGTFNRYLSGMSSEGLIERLSGRVTLTVAGNAVAESPNTAPTLRELHDRICGVVLSSKQMGDPHVRILREILTVVPPDAVASTALAERTGYTASGGTFSRYLSALSGVGLIVRKNGMVRASALCFPQQLRWATARNSKEAIDG
jgi:ABC-type oligopeptide transport system ATPase subunit